MRDPVALLNHCKEYSSIASPPLGFTQDTHVWFVLAPFEHFPTCRGAEGTVKILKCFEYYMRHKMLKLSFN